MTLIQNVRLKSESDMHNLYAEEKENRAEYGKFVRDTVGDIRRWQDSAAANSGVASQLTEDVSEFSNDADAFEEEKDSLAKQLDEQMNGPCKKLKNNFNKWQSARSSEIDGLKSAAAIFATAAEQYASGAGNA